jgi:hypothetical protein
MGVCRCSRSALPASHYAPVSKAAPAAPWACAALACDLCRHAAGQRWLMSCPCPHSVFLRGSHVNFMVLPDILKNAPFFKKIDTKANKASKSGKAKQAATQRAAGEARVRLLSLSLSVSARALTPHPHAPRAQDGPRRGCQRQRDVLLARGRTLPSTETGRQSHG